MLHNERGRSFHTVISLAFDDAILLNGSVAVEKPKQMPQMNFEVRFPKFKRKSPFLISGHCGVGRDCPATMGSRRCASFGVRRSVGLIMLRQKFRRGSCM